MLKGVRVYTILFFRTLRWGGVLCALWMSLLIAPGVVRAVEPAPKISDREIIESLAEIKGDIKHLGGEIKRLDQRLDSMEKRLDSMEKRLDSMEKRMDSMEKRFDERFVAMDRRFDELRNELREFMLWGFGVTFAGIFTLMGFVLWDRRTALVPAIAKNKELEERATRIENILKEVIQRDPNLAEALRHARLL